MSYARLNRVARMGLPSDRTLALMELSRRGRSTATPLDVRVRELVTKYTEELTAALIRELIGVGPGDRSER